MGAGRQHHTHSREDLIRSLLGNKWHRDDAERKHKVHERRHDHNSREMRRTGHGGAVHGGDWQQCFGRTYYVARVRATRL